MPGDWLSLCTGVARQHASPRAGLSAPLRQSKQAGYAHGKQRQPRRKSPPSPEQTRRPASALQEQPMTDALPVIKIHARAFGHCQPNYSHASLPRRGSAHPPHSSWLLLVSPCFWGHAGPQGAGRAALSPLCCPTGSVLLCLHRKANTAPCRLAPLPPGWRIRAGTLSPLGHLLGQGHGALVPCPGVPLPCRPWGQRRRFEMPEGEERRWEEQESRLVAAASLTFLLAVTSARSQPALVKVAK